MSRERIVYFSLMLLLIVMISITCFSYAFFTNKSEDRGKLNIVAGTLDYSLKSKYLSNNTITSYKGTDKLYLIDLTSLNNIDTKYELYYENVNGVTIGYDATYDLPSGTINSKTTKTIGVRIINTSNNDVNVTLGIKGGLINNNIQLENDNYKKITTALTESLLGKANRTISKLEEYYDNTNPSSLVTLTFPTDYETIGIDDITLEGHAYIKSNGRIGYQVENSEKCIVKRYDYDDVEIFNNVNDICDKQIYKNLIKNGYGEYQNNTNFTSLTYDSTDGSFYYKGVNKDFQNNDFIPMDVNKTYYMAVDVNSIGNSTLNYAGYGEYDYDKLWVSPLYFAVYPQTLTTLARDLKKGDKEIYVTDLSNWVENTPNSYRRGIQVWGYTDGSGYTWPANTYSRYGYDNQFDNDGLDKANNKIILRDQVNGWQGENFPAGTQLSQKNGNWGYTYNLVGGSAISSSEYQHYENVRSTHRYGSHYMKFIFLFRGEGSPTRHIKNIVFEEVD